jgi:hypothetical protein
MSGRVTRPCRSWRDEGPQAAVQGRYLRIEREVLCSGAREREESREQRERELDAALCRLKSRRHVHHDEGHQSPHREPDGRPSRQEAEQESDAAGELTEASPIHLHGTHSRTSR